MHIDLTRRYARKLGVALRCPTEKEAAVISIFALPERIHAVISQGWFDQYSDYGGLEIYDLATICEEMNAKYVENLPRGGYLPIGKAGNGDILVIKFTQDDLPVGYIRLSRWPGEAPSSDAFITVEPSLEKFLLRGLRRPTISEIIMRRSRYPLDSYDAENEKQGA